MAENAFVCNNMYKILDLKVCVDGTHVGIKGPSEDEPAYINRKMYLSINDHEGRFTNVNAIWPGSTHDAHVFRTSAVGRYLQDNFKGIEQGVLLGDSGYPCRSFLLTPHRQTNNRRQERFNCSHTSTRVTIQRTFEIWKKRFYILRSEIRMTPRKACRIMIACAILHNIDIMMNELEVEDDEDVDQQPPLPHYNGQQDRRGIRDNFSANFFAQ